MKVVKTAIASIVLVVSIAVSSDDASAAEAECSCAAKWYDCLNVASQADGFLERTWEEQQCYVEYFACVRHAVAG